MGPRVFYAWLMVMFFVFSSHGLGEEVPEIIKTEEKPPENPADLPPLKLFDKPYEVSAGVSLGVASLNGTDISNGGKANLGAITSGLRFEWFRAMRTVEHTAELQLRFFMFSRFSSTRLINLNQSLYPGLNWHTRFVDKSSSLNWVVGGGINSVPYYSNLAVTTVTMDGALSLMAFGGARVALPGLESIYLRNAEAHVGVQLPLMSTGYRGGFGLWQRLRVVFDKPWGDSEKRWLVGWIDFTNSSEGTNLENQSQMNVAFWIFGKWRLDPSAPEPPK